MFVFGALLRGTVAGFGVIVVINYFLRPEPSVLFTFAAVTLKFCQKFILQYFVGFSFFVLVYNDFFFNFQLTNRCYIEKFWAKEGV